MTIRFIDPDTGQENPYGETGVITLKGPNIFEGYLGQPEKTKEVLKDGWFTTGDIGRMDEDGFIFIEGRLSRFSKIGGEMVPHGTVEEAIVKALELDLGEGPVIAVAGKPDVAKGEALVLLHAIDLDLKELRTKLSEAGLANLWIPKNTQKLSQYLRLLLESWTSRQSSNSHSKHSSSRGPGSVGPVSALHGGLGKSFHHGRELLYTPD